MDIATIKLPVEAAEAEPPANSLQASDPAFLQLLASLGLTPPLPVDDGPGITANDILVAQTESLGIEPSRLMSASTVNVIQEQMITVGKANAEAAQAGTQLPEVAAQVITSVRKDDSDAAGTVMEALAASKKDGLAKDQPLNVQEKPALPAPVLPNAKGTAESISQSTTVEKAQAAPARLVELALPGPVQNQLAGPSATTPGSNGATSNTAIHVSETPVKHTTAAASSLVWSAVPESSDLQQSGTEHGSASSDRDSGKERFTSAEANGTFSTPAPVAASFTSQAPSASTRTAPAALVEAPTFTPPQDSPLPASVRFEVQPGDMGRIRVHLSVVDHTVYTNVVTDRVEAHDHLVRSSDRFEAGLAAHGLEVGRFHVDVQGQAGQHGNRHAMAWSQDDLRRHAAQPTEQPMAERHAIDREADRMHGMISVFA